MLAFRIASSCCLLAMLVASTVPLSFSLSGSSTIEVQVTNKTMGTNQLSLGFQPDWNSANGDLFVQSSSLKGLSKDANFKLIRVFDFGRTNPRLMPCTYWNESSRTGTWDWTNVDSLVKAVFAIGAEPLFCLGWAGSNIQGSIPRGMAVNPNTGLPYPGSYAAYAREWVSHFKSTGAAVRFYEIMNEPWSYFGWNDYTKIGYYEALFNAAAGAMRAVNPNILVSFDGSNRKPVLTYWLSNGGANLDFISFHKYDENAIGRYSDATMLNRAETFQLQTDSSYYGVQDAQQAYYNARGKWLSAINSESNFNSAYATGTDPKIQQMVGAVWTALELRTGILVGLNYNIYFNFMDSGSSLSKRGLAGQGFGMINSDNNLPWYPYYVQKMIGQSLAVNDALIETVSSSDDVRALAWLHNGELIILLICKADGPRTIVLQGVTGPVNYFRIDNNISWQTPKMQAGTLDSSGSIDMNGYTVMVLLASISGPQPLAGPAFRDGFESGGFGAWNGSYVSPGETANVVKTLPYQGSYSAKFASNGTGGFEGVYCYNSVTASSSLYAGGCFYMSRSGITGNDDRFYLIEFLAGGNGVAYAGWRRIGGVDLWSLIIRDAIGWASASSSFSPSLDEWHSVGLYWAEGAADGYGELYVDGWLACSIQNQNTTAFGGINQVRLGLPEVYNCGPTTVYADSCRILATPSWDINQDGTVNVQDLAILAKTYGSTPRDSEWDINADVDGDGAVGLSDIAILARYYGHNYP